MRANTPASLAASLTLHGVVLAVILLLTFLLARPPEVPPVIFELVAGPPTNPEALVAGTTAQQLKVDLPDIKPLSPEVLQPPEPVREEVVVPPEPAPKAPPKPEPKKVEPKKAEPKKAETKKAEPPKQISYDQFVKDHGKPQPKQPTKSTAPIRAPRINTNDITRDLVRGGGGGTALTRAEQDLLATYLARLRRALLLAHDRPPGLSDDLEVQVTFNIAASGDITNVRVTRSSGYPEFDQSALEAFRKVGSIGPTPGRRAETWTLRFRVGD